MWCAEPVHAWPTFSYSNKARRDGQNSKILASGSEVLFFLVALLSLFVCLLDAMWKFTWLMLNCVHCPVLVKWRSRRCDTFQKKASSPGAVWNSFERRSAGVGRKLCICTVLVGATRGSGFSLYKNHLNRFFLVARREDWLSQSRAQFSWGLPVLRVQGRPDHGYKMLSGCMSGHVPWNCNSPGHLDSQRRI